MSLNPLLSRWRAEPTIAGNITDWRVLPERRPRLQPFPEGLHPTLIEALHAQGIDSLYSHQAGLWRHVAGGYHPILVTGTASGKTLAYNLPVLNRLLADNATRALYLFPTKALTQDQAQTLKNFLTDGSGVPIAVYDGDTPSQYRPGIRQEARLLLTNPDMLHAGILPYHTRWASFFQELAFVVIDEVHVYRGVFGSHFANVIRRLKRIASFYGAQIQFILTSATIANPVELAEKLVEEEVQLIDEDGSGRGPRNFLIYNPPVVDQELGIRRSALLESVRLAEDLLTYDVQTIVFGRTRRSVELILTYLRDRASGEISQKAQLISTNNLHEPGDQETIRGYRSGYLPRQRREIEHGLRRGSVRAVVATNALELGVDIGGMGAAVLAGYTGTIAGTWQQAGRAGRGDEPSLAVLVATASPLDQYFALHPDYFFGRSPENALINPDNLLILLAHLRCAVFELPFLRGEPFGRVSGELVNEYLNFLIESGLVHESGDKHFWMADHYPAADISLRSASPDRVLLQTPGRGGWETIGEVDVESAGSMVHPQAVYLHEAQTFLVDELDLEQNIARLRPSAVDYYTQPMVDTNVLLLEVMEQSSIPGGRRAYGEILVTTQIKGFRKLKWFTHEQLAQGGLDLPPSQLNTTGFWVSLDQQTVEQLRESGVWTNDPNDYGPNWSAQRDRARARDNYRCQICGILESGTSHDVHHKIPFRTFHSSLEANQLHNLVTLCRSCHRKAETAVRMRSGLSGLAYALGNLAPIFLMCDSRDIQVHADPRSPLADGDPSVLLYELIPAGIGFSQRLYEVYEELIEHAHELIAACPCSDGCPSCVGPAGENGYGGKQESLAILQALLWHN